MNRRVAIALSSVMIGTVAVTGCGAMGSTHPHGIVVEKDEKVTRTGTIKYELEIATDSKTNRKGKVTSKTKTTEVTVSKGKYKTCGLKERYPNC